MMGGDIEKKRMGIDRNGGQSPTPAVAPRKKKNDISIISLCTCAVHSICTANEKGHYPQ
jgi:hypothetical protein